MSLKCPVCPDSVLVPIRQTEEQQVMDRTPLLDHLRQRHGEGLLDAVS